MKIHTKVQTQTLNDPVALSNSAVDGILIMYMLLFVLVGSSLIRRKG